MLHTLYALLLVAQSVPDSAALPSVDEVIAKMVQRDQGAAVRLSWLHEHPAVRARKHQPSQRSLHDIVRMGHPVQGRIERIQDCDVQRMERRAEATVFPKLLDAEGKHRSQAVPRIPASHRRTTPSRGRVSMKSMVAKPYALDVVPKKQKKISDARNHLGSTPKTSPSCAWRVSPPRIHRSGSRVFNSRHKYEKHGSFWLAASDSSVAMRESSGPLSCGSTTSITS